MDIEVESNSTIENSKYLKIMDEAFRLLCYSIFLDLLYHIYSHPLESTRGNEGPPIGGGSYELETK